MSWGSSTTERAPVRRRRLVPDTNVLLRALRDRDAGEAFRVAVRRHALALALASPVEMELRAGVRSAAAADATDRLLGALGADGRRLTPGPEAWAEAGRVIAALAVREGMASAALRGSFATDVLLAATCREHGALLVTENAADFERIGRHLRGFRYVTRWPA
jgi:predicted nucleic acid-binding protein